MRQCNLVPQATRQRLLFRRRLSQWAIIWTICLICAGVFSSWQLQQYRESQEILVRQQKESRHILDRIERHSSLRQQKTELEIRKLELQQLTGQFSPLHLLGVIGSGTSSTANQIQISTFNSAQIIEPNKQAKEAQTNRLQLSLSGIAAHGEALSQFVDGLKAYPFVENIDLKSASEFERDGVIQKQFRVEVVFVEPEIR